MSIFNATASGASSMSWAQVAEILDPLDPLEAADVLTNGTLTEFRGRKLPGCNFENDQLRWIDAHCSMSPTSLDAQCLKDKGLVQ